MIDSHFHLEQPQYNGKRDELVAAWKKSLKAVITSCAHPRDFEATLSFVKRFPNFIFATAGLHPQYITELSNEQIEKHLQAIKTNSSSIIGIGEIGLDYHWITNETEQKQTRELFRKMLSFAKDLNKPVIIHNWESGPDTVRILEEFSPKKVQMHMWGEQKLLKQVIDNGWYISVGPSIFQSKQRKKIVRDFPLERMFLETDSPWFPMKNEAVGYPTNIRFVAERIAEIKKLDFETVWQTCEKNVEKFYKLNPSKHKIQTRQHSHTKSN
jgi:TatD DNase family protein